MWFVFALIATVMWGGSDLFSKMGTDPKDKLSHWRMVIMVGAVMGLHAAYTCISGAITGDYYFNLSSLIAYSHVSLLYILAMVIGYAGLRYIELSVSSPICNSSGAVAVILSFIFITQDDVGVIQIAAIVTIFLCIFLLAVFQKRKDDGELRLSGETVEKKYRVGFLAIFLPILYCIIDGLGTFSDSLILKPDDPVLKDDQVEVAYEITFLLIAICAFIYLRFIKKEKFSFFNERVKGLGAVCETIGQFFYVKAFASQSAVIAAPIISCYCVISVILSRIVLKEKLKAVQYAIIVVVFICIGTLGIFDEFSTVDEFFGQVRSTLGI